MTKHQWTTEATEDGKICFTIGDTRYLFSTIGVTCLCSELLALVVDVSDGLGPAPRKLEDRPPFKTFTFESMTIEREDPLDQFRKSA
jgi:hypothetical protein